MKRLKKRQRIDNLKTEVRKPKGTWGKWVYLAVMSVMLLWIVDLFVGHYFYLKANGMVVRDTYTTSLNFSAQFQRLDVKEGSWVRKGDLLGQVVSMEVIQQLSALSLKITDIDLQISESRSRLASIEATLSIAKKRAEDMIRLRGNQEEAVKRGLVSTQHMSELLQDEFDSQLKYKEMLAQRDFIQSELAQLSQSRSELQKIQQQVRDIYQEGHLYARESGIVANLVTHSGSTVKSGDKVLDILHGSPYVLAYIDPGSLYNVEENKAVTIRYGAEVLEGTVEKIYPLSTELPKEFQRTFRPLERSTIVRVALKDVERTLPVFTTVQIYASGSLIAWVKTLLS